MNLVLDRPEMLWVALVALPAALLAWRTTRGHDPARRIVSIGLRTLVIAGLALLLAGPNVERRHDGLTVVGLVDVSGSVQRFAQLPPPPEQPSASYLATIAAWLRDATDTRDDDDRVGLVVFDGRASTVLAPTRADVLEDALVATTYPGTDIEDAVRLGLALFPPEGGRRLVLVSDGNETAGDALAAAETAATGGLDGRGGRIPIDVLPVTYRVENDVQVVRVDAPGSARPGQTVPVRVVLESARPVTGRLVLRLEGEAIDLNGDAPGTSRPIRVPAGRSVEIVPVELLDAPVNRLEALFEPDVPGADALADNNRAGTITTTPGRGRILVVSRAAGRAEVPIAEWLREADLPVEEVAPPSFPGDVLGLQAYDLVVLDDVAAFEMDEGAVRGLARYVRDLGGGLLVAGGSNSFGAGGWTGSALADVLPVDVDPPKELILPQAALVLVLDRSGSMSRNVAGARASQQEVANEAAARAVESLRRESLVGVVSFSAFPQVVVPLRPNDDPLEIAEQIRGIIASGGTDIAPALQRAYDMLQSSEAERRQVVLLTDGRSPSERLPGIAERMRDEGIRLTTIAVGDEADHELLEELATIGDGDFFPVYNPTTLPRVLVDSVQVLNKPLVKETPFRPVLEATGSDLGAPLANAPELRGIVVTGARPDPRAIVEASHPDGEPLLARWQVGLGRVAAFTSDAGGRWTSSWSDWPGTQRFWLEVARSVARPVTSGDATMLVRTDGDELHVVMEAADEDGFLDHLDVTGTVFDPTGAARSIRLRQTAPGRYETRLPADRAGDWIVSLTPRRGDRLLPPLLGGTTRTGGAEFRRLASNVDLLDRMVETTDGRRLDPARPEAVDLFDRRDMPPSISLQPVRDLLVVLLASLFLLDVASRRIAWTGTGVQARLRRLVDREAARERRATASAATLAGLRKGSEAREEREAQQPKVEVERQRGPRRFTAAEIEAMVARERRSEEAAQRRAEEEARGTTTRATVRDRRTAPADTEAADESGDEAAEGSTTRSLLAAKRRARRELEGD